MLDSYKLVYNNITRSGRQDSFNPITIPKFPIPTLLKHNQTVLKLETVGVRARMRPDDLKLILERLGVPRNNIKVQIKVARKGIKTNITCTKLADTCRLQCLFLLKKLTWSYKDPKQYLIEGDFKIIPKDEIIASIELNSQTENSENTLISILHSHPTASDIIFSYLDKTELFNLYIATHKSTAVYRTFCFPEINALQFPFNGRTSIDLIYKAINTYNPTQLSFPSMQDPLEPNSILRILRLVVKKNAQEEIQKISRLKKLDLSGIMVNDGIFAHIKEKMCIKQMKICDTSMQVNHQFKYQGLEKLEVLNNGHFTGRGLNDLNFEMLQSIILINCKRIQLLSLVEIAIGKHVKTLVITHGISHKDLSITIFLQKVMSEESTLQTFHFNFTEVPNFQISQAFQPLFIGNCYLKELNVKNNTLLKFFSALGNPRHLRGGATVL